jgi:hypothetical protein
MEKTTKPFDNGSKRLTLTCLFASLAFTAPEDKEWLRRRFTMLKDIFAETPLYEYLLELTRDQVEPQVRAQALEEGRKEGLQVLLQDLHKSLIVIVQSRFPKLIKLAKTQSRQIKDATVMSEILTKVGAAQTIEEAEEALLNCLPGADSEE